MKRCYMIFPRDLFFWKRIFVDKKEKKKQKNTKNKKNTEKWGRILKEHNYIKDVRSSYLIPRTFQSKTNNKILTITM